MRLALALLIFCSARTHLTFAWRWHAQAFGAPRALHLLETHRRKLKCGWVPDNAWIRATHCDQWPVGARSVKVIGLKWCAPDWPAFFSKPVSQPNGPISRA